MIQVIPSIAIRHGQVVKMRKGDPSSEKAYDENPWTLPAVSKTMASRLFTL